MAEHDQIPEDSGSRYPFVTLEKALGRAKQLHDEAGDHEMLISDAFEIWGYSLKSSGGHQTIAALKMYGLLQDSGVKIQRKLAITDKGQQYFRDEREEALTELKREFAIGPKLIGALWRKWGDTPPADNIARSYLKIDCRLSDQAARSLLGIYKENLAFADLKGSGKVGGKDDEKAIKIGDTVNWVSQGQTQWQAPWKVIEIKAHDDGEQYLRVEGPDVDESGWIPMNEAVQQDAATVGPTGDGQMLTPPPKPNAADAPPPKGARREVFALDEGDVVLTYPDELSVDSYDDLDGYLKLFLKKARRRAGVPEPKQNGPKEQGK